MVTTEIEEQVKPFVKAPLLKTKIPSHNFIIPLDLPVHFWLPTHIESPFEKAIDLFTDNADFIAHSLTAMDESFLF